MDYYPIFVDIKGKNVLVVGGGVVAERKVMGLIKAGAIVTVISPTLTAGLKKITIKSNVKTKNNNKIKHIARRYKSGFLGGEVLPDDKKTNPRWFLVVSATGSLAVSEAVSMDAEALGVLVNVADKPKLSNFILPAVVERGALTIAISTSGQSPYLAKTIKDSLDENLPAGLETFIELVGKIRNKLLKSKTKNVIKSRVYALLMNSPVLGWIEEGDKKEINKFLKKILGKGWSLSTLGVKI